MAYERKEISVEMREAFLYAQMQGLPYELVQAPAVSGAQSYPQLFVAAKSEERRLAALTKRQQLQTGKFAPNTVKQSPWRLGGSDGASRDKRTTKWADQE